MSKLLAGILYLLLVLLFLEPKYGIGYKSRSNRTVCAKNSVPIIAKMNIKRNKMRPKLLIFIMVDPMVIRK